MIISGVCLSKLSLLSIIFFLLYVSSLLFISVKYLSFKLELQSFSELWFILIFLSVDALFKLFLLLFSFVY